MPKLSFCDFIACFRKQFIFQVGKGGRRISPYYTAQNSEQGLKNDKWGIMVFIHTGSQYGFSDLEMMDELKIRKSLYEVLKEEVAAIIKNGHSHNLLHKKIMCKIGLVYNCVFYTHKILAPVEENVAS